MSAQPGVDEDADLERRRADALQAERHERETRPLEAEDSDETEEDRV